MSLSIQVKEIMREMISIQQMLRKTSPQHRLTEDEMSMVLASISKCEDVLRIMKERVVSK